jgi:integrase
MQFARSAANHWKDHNMSATRTFADLIALAKADQALLDSRRRHVASDLKIFLREAGRQPAAVPATIAGARELIQAMRQRPLGVTPKRWSNIRASVNFALARYCDMPEEQHWEAGRELEGDWRELRDRIITDLDIHIPLSRLFRYCALKDIAPDQVSVAMFPEFRVWLEQRTTVIDPAGRYRQTCLAWNRAAALVPGWPPILAPIEGRRTKEYSMPEALPASFRADVEKWRRVLARDDLFAKKARKRPLRPDSVKHIVGTVYRFASGMIRQGVPAAELGSMADLFEPERFKLGLRFQLARHAGEPSPGITQMTAILLPVAREWVEIDPEQYEILHDDAKAIECRQTGLTPTNLRRLAQFDDPGNICLLYDLPEKLLELARRRSQLDREGALLVQLAVAILILLLTAIRLRNLAGCHLERNIVRNGSGRRQAIRFVFERQEVKGHRMLSKPIPDVLARALDLYIKSYRSLLVGAREGGWLFPGRRPERPKAKEALARQITKTIRQHTGLVVNVHLFRHLAALLIDQDDPGNIDRIRLHLDHLSGDTTHDFYSGFASDRAARRFHEQVLGRMSKGKRGSRS